MPQFVRSRLASVENLVAMAADEGWALGAEDRSRVVAALTYFADPEDLIPDNIPVLGFLDDAIMIEVAERLLKPEIDAYADFCAYRKDEGAYRSADAGTLSRDEWLKPAAPNCRRACASVAALMPRVATGRRVSSFGDSGNHARRT